MNSTPAFTAHVLPAACIRSHGESFAPAFGICVAMCAGLAGCGFPRPADVSGEFPEDGNTGGVVIRVAPTGDDANDGVSQPVKTLRRGLALAAVTSGATVELAVGQYAATSGESFPYQVPSGIIIAGAAPSGAVLVGAGADGLVVSGSTLRDLELTGFATAIRAAGELTGSNLHVKASKLAVRGEAGARISLAKFEVLGVNNVVDGRTCGIGAELVGGGSLTADTVVARSLSGFLTLQDHSTASIQHAEIVGDPRCDGAALLTQSDGALSVADSSVVGTSTGITAVGSTTARAVVSLRNTVVRNIRYSAVGGTNVMFEMVGGELSYSQFGISRAGPGSWTLTNAQVSNHSASGIAVFGDSAQSIASLRLRGCTIANNRNGLEAFDYSAVDLGTSASPGGNTLQDNLVEGVLVSSSVGPEQVDAVGNTWNANVQGADAAGHYLTAATILGPVGQAAGNNYTIFAGRSLRR